MVKTGDHNKLAVLIEAKSLMMNGKDERTTEAGRITIMRKF